MEMVTAQSQQLVQVKQNYLNLLKRRNKKGKKLLAKNQFVCSTQQSPRIKKTIKPHSNPVTYKAHPSTHLKTRSNPKTHSSTLSKPHSNTLRNPEPDHQSVCKEQVRVVLEAVLGESCDDSLFMALKVR